MRLDSSVSLVTTLQAMCRKQRFYVHESVQTVSRAYPLGVEGYYRQEKRLERQANQIFPFDAELKMHGTVLPPLIWLCDVLLN